MSSVKNLLLSYDDGTKISIPAWELPELDTVGLSGPSGSGKSTVVRALLGLEPCGSLQWIWNGVDIMKLSMKERRLGVVFQTFELFPHMSAEKNILFAARARDLAAQEIESGFRTLVEKLHLQNILKKPAHVLSGGEQQRVALARALIGKPRYLFLDEPFSALDAELRSEARNLVKEVLDAAKTPAMIISHDPQDFQVLCKRVFTMSQGQLAG
jgi:ABC-type sugar transport system ATPase subunit